METPVPRLSEADFSLLESVPDAMVIAHRDGGIVFVNGVAERLFGWSRGEIVGHPVEVLLPARFRAMHQVHRSSYQSAPRTRPMGLGLDLFALRKDGTEFAAEISLAPLTVGGESYAIAAVRDVTERKKLEGRALLVRKAQEEVRERDEFLSVASHELRTPVTALQLQLQLLQRAGRASGAGMPAALVGKMEALERQTRRIAVLVNELLDVSRLRLGRLELRPEPLDLAEVAREAVAQLVDEAARHGSRVAVVAGQPVRGRWDRMRIEQVLTNLLANAVKFGQGKPITVAVGLAGERARVEVRDEGIGIEADDLARIFGRFERAVSTQHFGGLGLGLYIAREIAEAHGGSIDVASTPGEGTTFTVELPCTPPALEKGPARAG
ncbi:MAG TPA: PAS domain-containing sensor histidine kinase [Anaeromyxobacteraceae bacterium]|nr:PAS domain-containing sensor histidine kinase [Anaeromyxobacteraceae bacterium]